VRGIRSALRATGALGALDRRAKTSTVAKWFRSLFAVYDLDDLIALDTPWWTFTSSRSVDEFLKNRPSARAFEWGSGASTVWLAKRCASVDSVEHDAGWSSAVTGKLPSNATLHLIEAVPATGTGGIRSQKPGHAGLDFTAYVDEIDKVDGDFDVIVVDGRAREACFARAVTRLAPDGIIVFDNVGRARYRQAIREQGSRISTRWTRGMTPCLPYPDQTAIITLAG
jgi:hypothetical protein